MVLRKIGEGSMGVVYAGYDVALDRKVALKLVQRKLVNKPRIRARMVREAQALARLSSPYVVQVYQVGEHADGIYLAMEYVEGEDLRAWFRDPKIGWRQLLRALCDAGRGLAAAHAAGLIHRDFKPENVLVGRDGRARVLDFGLVLSEGEDDLEDDDGSMVGPVADAKALMATMEATESPPPEVTTRRPRMRRVAGTPAYMSPEQHFGGAVGPASDLFSFAITVYEALYGVRPFEGSSWREIQEKVRRGVIPPPPPDSPVPRWLFRVVQRGLQRAPEDRWPDIEAMVAALEKDPRRARLRALGIGGLLIGVSALSYGLAASQARDVGACAAADTALDGVWDEGRRGAVERAFRGTGAAFAEEAWSRTGSRLDTYAGAWRRGYRSACEAHASGSQTDHLMDLRIACLDRRRASLKALVEVLEAADSDAVENAIQAVAALPGVEACADVDMLLAAVPPPENPAIAARVDEVRAELATVAALENTGGYERAIALASAARAAAGDAGYPPLVVEAALAEGSVLMAAGRFGEATSTLDEALRGAITLDLHGVAAEAVAKAIFGRSQLGQPAEALALASIGESLVARARGDAHLSGLLHNNIGAAHRALGATEAATREFARSVEILSGEGGAIDPLLPVTHHNLGNMSLDSGDLDAAGIHYERAYALFAESLGEHHPLAGHPLAGLADVARERGAFDEARVRYERALAQMEAAYGGEHLYLVHPLSGLGEVHRRLGAPAIAEHYYRRVVSICDASGIKLSFLGEALVGLGEMAAEGGRLAEARADFERAVTVHEAGGAAEAAAAAEASLRAGEIAALLGDADAARARFEMVLVREAASPSARGRAALGLIRLLDPEGERARICELATEAEGLVTDGTLRDEAAAARVAACTLAP